MVYKLTTKTDVLAGTQTNVFVGGTENNSYIEIGTVATALAIPQNICIFWDSETSTPGTGWTEVTTFDGRYIKFSGTYGTTASAVAHTHPITGSTYLSTAGSTITNDNQASGVANNHYHNYSVTSAGSTAGPRYVNMRMFYKNASTTEYEFPDGATIMYDQTAVPEGWTMMDFDGYYIRFGTTDLGLDSDSIHTHTFSGTTGREQPNEAHPSQGGTNSTGTGHGHPISGSTNAADMSSWVLGYVSFRFIKKTGESSTWDGTAKYAYALYNSAGTPGNGWAEITTYNNKFLKIGTGAPAVGVASNASHTHTTQGGTTGDDNNRSGGTDAAKTSNLSYHTHSFGSGSATAGTATDPDSVTFRLFRKVLGKMKDYNAEWETPSLLAGTWTSPAAQLAPDTLKSLWWNESLSGGANILVYLRTGASKVICEAAAWQPVAGYTNPNAQSLSSITIGIWVQVKVEFSRIAQDLVDGNNPKLYSANGFLVKFTYSKGAVIAEDAVEFIYDIGFRHFDQPAVDKIFQKILSRHEGEFGSFSVYWETENASNLFTISLGAYPARWDSFFPSDAFGKEVKLKVYKNDLFSFKLKELQGFFSPQPILI